MNALSTLVQDPAFALAYRVRDPAPVRPTSLLLLLHGVGGNETNLAGLAAGIAPDVLVVLPRGPLTLGAAQHAWFRVAFTADGPQIVADEAEASRQLLVRFIAQLQAAHGIAPGTHADCRLQPGRHPQRQRRADRARVGGGIRGARRGASCPNWSRCWRHANSSPKCKP